MGYYDNYENDREMQERDLKIVWSCPNNDGYEYEECPNCNEALPCPRCGAICVQSGESYLSKP